MVVDKMVRGRLPSCATCFAMEPATYTHSTYVCPAISNQGLLPDAYCLPPCNPEERKSAIFHRSNWGVGPRRGLMPLLRSYTNGSAGVKDVDAFGVPLDIEDTGFVSVHQGKAQSRCVISAW